MARSCVKVISDASLLALVDIFERHVGEIADTRAKQHALQFGLVYKTFERVLPERIKDRYQQLISRSK